MSSVADPAAGVKVAGPPPPVAVLTFGLHPGRTLRASLHGDVDAIDAYSIASKALAYDPPGESGDGIDSIGAGGTQRRRPGRFAIMDARRLVSLGHVAVAANAALLRTARWETTDRQNRGGDGGNGDGKKNEPSFTRGVAFETVLCAAGTSHTGYALRDYGFQPAGGGGDEGGGVISTSGVSSVSGLDGAPSRSVFTVLAFGYDCESDMKYQDFLSNVGLQSGGVETELIMADYFSRHRTKEETSDVMKAFKISQNEVDMDGSSLEQAVQTRISTKFIA